MRARLTGSGHLQDRPAGCGPCRTGDVVPLFRNGSAIGPIGVFIVRLDHKLQLRDLERVAFRFGAEGGHFL